MGHSAGAASVIYHMISPRTSGYFQRAIVMSGSVLSPWSRVEDPSKCSRAIARSLGCLAETSRTILQCLRSKSVEELLRAFEMQYKIMIYSCHDLSSRQTGVRFEPSGGLPVIISVSTCRTANQVPCVIDHPFLSRLVKLLTWRWVWKLQGMKNPAKDIGLESMLVYRWDTQSKCQAYLVMPFQRGG
uniref:(California timema) hypothetical protein n=1 Tax=Timema californicum TaxID=61474 RepID=A0A7R9JFV0_TIMCA|nr:unnamed protein product [Timema californicum]